MRVTLFSVMLLMASTGAHAQVEASEAGQNPFAIVTRALQRGQKMSQGELASFIERRIAAAELQSANSLLMIAELLRQAGDHRAEEYYEKAIGAGNDYDDQIRALVDLVLLQLLACGEVNRDRSGLLV